MKERASTQANEILMAVGEYIEVNPNQLFLLSVLTIRWSLTGFAVVSEAQLAWEIRAHYNFFPPGHNRCHYPTACLAECLHLNALIPWGWLSHAPRLPHLFASSVMCTDMMGTASMPHVLSLPGPCP